MVGPSGTTANRHTTSKEHHNPMDTTKTAPAPHVHGPDCNHDHDHGHAPGFGHVHGPDCNHDHGHAHSHPMTPIRTTKIGRNDACPCGSGRKYKKCCLANAQA